MKKFDPKLLLDVVLVVVVVGVVGDCKLLLLLLPVADVTELIVLEFLIFWLFWSEGRSQIQRNLSQREHKSVLSNWKNGHKRATVTKIKIKNTEKKIKRDNQK